MRCPSKCVFYFPFLSTLDVEIIQEKKEEHDEFLEENIAVGFLFASKAFVQLITNAFVGPLTNR
jgi:hypothetical protein